MEKPVRILGFVGSLRKGSYNKALMRTAVELVPDDATIEVFDLEGIPPFNQDWENNPPQIVRDFKAKIRAADALLIATPEYNYSIPGVLKNAIDAASRPYADKVFDGKPVAIMSASTGHLGARAQYHLRQSFVFLNMYPINHPEVMLSLAGKNIDVNGNLTNEETRKLIRELLEELVRWTRKLKAAE
ncbi:NAD(P)H-dependent oxidoreductase [Candidatus Bathyarchaeota archaeon A05DMB-2]|jgi:chromate reductase|nr:NAD(P)H-dependent oxidoreductase [Candidatus Bathyarchaeota archaeon A05DMB-2]